MGFTDHLTREERIQRIGQLLAKGISLLLAREAEERRLAISQVSTAAADQPAPHFQDQHGAGSTNGLDDDERKILEYLRRMKTASPRNMQSYLELSKATLYRKLRQLLDANLVTASGKTTGIRYRWAGPAEVPSWKRLLSR